MKVEEKNKKKKNKNGYKKKVTKKVNTKTGVKEKVETKTENQGIKKEKFKNEESVVITGNEISNLVKIVLIIVAVFLIFYGITSLVTDKKSKNDPETGEVTIQYDEILFGTLFEQPNSEYFVLVTKEDDHYNVTYENLLSMYSYVENAIRVYKINLDDGFNKSYEAEESNITNELSQLKLSGATLLKIQNKQIVASYEGKTEIVEQLNSLLK